jgi:hypothetical protein
MMPTGRTRASRRARETSAVCRHQLGAVLEALVNLQIGEADVLAAFGILGGVEAAARIVEFQGPLEVPEGIIRR